MTTDRRCLIEAQALCFDPYLGSGTTAIVALKMGRRAIGCDVVPGYIKLAADRILAATGVQAV